MPQELEIGEPHDFRPSAARWGWRVQTFALEDLEGGIKLRSFARMTAIGKEVKNGEYVLLSHGSVDVVWRLSEVVYESNPPDLFAARLEMVGVPA